MYITDDATEYEPKKPFFFLCLFPAPSQCLRSAKVKGDTTRDLSSQNELRRPSTQKAFPLHSWETLLYQGKKINKTKYNWVFISSVPL